MVQVEASLLLVQSTPALVEFDPRGVSPAQAGDRPDHFQDVLDVGRVDGFHDTGAGQRGAGFGDVAACDLAEFPRVFGEFPEFFDSVALTPPVDVAAASPFAEVLRLDRLAGPVPFEHRPHLILGVEPLEDLGAAPAVVEAAIEFGAEGQREAGDLALAGYVGFVGHVGYDR
ncbi:MAG: hypothetical protein LV481_09255 [Methylacidiphilales bacterium]|nr:hypothetical protein [Candidatus Methylacidiphilales bacterium]